MKIVVCLTVALLSLPALADTYTGVVSDLKHFHNGGVAVDLDGDYPDQKMTFYVPPKNEATIETAADSGDQDRSRLFEFTK